MHPLFSILFIITILILSSHFIETRFLHIENGAFPNIYPCDNPCTPEFAFEKIYLHPSSINEGFKFLPGVYSNLGDVYFNGSIKSLKIFGEGNSHVEFVNTKFILNASEQLTVVNVKFRSDNRSLNIKSGVKFGDGVVKIEKVNITNCMFKLGSSLEMKSKMFFGLVFLNDVQFEYPIKDPDLQFLESLDYKRYDMALMIEDFNVVRIEDVSLEGGGFGGSPEYLEYGLHIFNFLHLINLEVNDLRINGAVGNVMSLNLVRNVHMEFLRVENCGPLTTKAGSFEYDHGNLVWILESTDVRFQNSIIMNNFENSIGYVGTDGMSVIDEDPYYFNNSSPVEGGAFRGESVSIHIFGGYFEHNSAFNGGAVAIRSSSLLSLSGTTFVGNFAEQRGADLFVHGSSILTEMYMGEPTVFVNSSSSYGSVYGLSSIINIGKFTRFENINDGCLYVEYPEIIAIHHASFHKCMGGSAIYISGIDPDGEYPRVNAITSISASDCSATFGSVLRLVNVENLAFGSSEFRNQSGVFLPQTFEIRNNSAEYGTFYFEESEIDVSTQYMDQMDKNTNTTNVVAFIDNEVQYGGVFYLKNSLVYQSVRLCGGGNFGECENKYVYQDNLAAANRRGKVLFVDNDFYDDEDWNEMLKALNLRENYDDITSPPRRIGLAFVIFEENGEISTTYFNESLDYHTIRVVPDGEFLFTIGVKVFDEFGHTLDYYEETTIQVEYSGESLLLGDSFHKQLFEEVTLFRELAFERWESEDEVEEGEIMISILNKPGEILIDVLFDPVPLNVFGELWAVITFPSMIVIIIVVFCVVLFLLLGLFCCVLGICSTFYFVSRKKLKKFDVIENVDLLIEEQKLEKGLEIAKFRINKALFSIEFDDIKLLKLIGSGGSQSNVYKCEYKGLTYAYKNFKTSTVLVDEKSFEEFEREVEILGSFRHKNILGFNGASIKPPRIGILMEYCANGDLKNFLQVFKEKNDKSYPFNEKMRMMKEVCVGMDLLHSKNVMHRDLKLENVLVDVNEVCKIMDFGLSRFVEDLGHSLTRGIGTSVYMSPELIKGEDYCELVDVYAFGIMFWIVLSENYKPYKEESCEFQVANNPLYRPSMKEISTHPKWVQFLIRTCWSHKDSNRPSFKDIAKVLNEKGGESIVIYILYTKNKNLRDIDDELAEDFLLKEKSIDKIMKLVTENWKGSKRLELFVTTDDRMNPLSNDEDVRKYVEEDCMIIARERE